MIITGKEEVKLSSFAGDMILQFKYSTQKNLRSDKNSHQMNSTQSQHMKTSNFLCVNDAPAKYTWQKSKRTLRRWKGTAGKKNGKWSANKKYIKYENVIIKQLFYILSKTANQERNITTYN